MSEQACRVLYAKYNSARKPEYRITTEICEDESGLFVRKRAGEDAARVHLDNIYENSVALRDYYRDIRVIPVERMDGALKFPYINGKTLAEQIETRQFDREAFVTQVNEQLDKVLSVQEKYVVPFEMTEGFEAAFGKVEISETWALNPANIDSLFTNFVENDTGIYCIDCEWVCHFPVPVAFVKYRILLYLYVTRLHGQLNGASLDEMLGWFGFSQQACATYWQMDDRFQQTAHGENRRYMYTTQYLKKNMPLANVEREYRSLEARIQELDARNQQLRNDYQAIATSAFWRMTKPARVATDGLKKTIKKNRIAYRASLEARDALRYGPMYTLRRVRNYLCGRRKLQLANTWPSEEEKERQRKVAFPREITFSILVPLYNTPTGFLREMIGSVQQQTYAKWELCLADGSDDAHGVVGEVCREIAREDARIRYRKLEKNLGISGNTNACIEMARGNYYALFDHDDILHPSALYEVMKAICEEGADYIYTDEVTFKSPNRKKTVTVHYKPDFAPDNLLANNYICHFSAFSAELVEAVGGFRPEYDGSQDHDMILRLTNAARKVVHIPRVLYWWRSHAQSVAKDITAKQYAVDAAKRAVHDFIRDHQNIEVEVRSTRAFPTIFQIVYPLKSRDRVSIIIPNKDHVSDLSRCIDSVIEKTRYDNYEIIVVENNSTEEETFRYYDQLAGRERVKILRYEGAFNYSKINNWAVQHSSGAYVVLLNNDTEVINPDWLENMLMYAQREDVGAVGAKLYFSDGKIQHGGIILKLGADRVAGHAHYGAGHENLGYMGRLSYAQDVSAVTAACLMVRREKYDEVNGLNEGLAVAYNDVDFCLKLRERGYLNIFTPFAELYHHESSSRGQDTGESRQRFMSECAAFRERWGDVLEKGDPYYNPNFSLDSSMFEPL